MGYGLFDCCGGCCDCGCCDECCGHQDRVERIDLDYGDDDIFAFPAAAAHTKAPSPLTMDLSEQDIKADICENQTAILEKWQKRKHQRQVRIPPTIKLSPPDESTAAASSGNAIVSNLKQTYSHSHNMLFNDMNGVLAFESSAHAEDTPTTGWKLLLDLPHSANSLPHLLALVKELVQKNIAHFEIHLGNNTGNIGLQQCSFAAATTLGTNCTTICIDFAELNNPLQLYQLLKFIQKIENLIIAKNYGFDFAHATKALDGGRQLLDCRCVRYCPEASATIGPQPEVLQRLLDYHTIIEALLNVRPVNLLMLPKPDYEIHQEQARRLRRYQSEPNLYTLLGLSNSTNHNSTEKERSKSADHTNDKYHDEHSKKP